MMWANEDLCQLGEQDAEIAIWPEFIGTYKFHPRGVIYHMTRSLPRSSKSNAVAQPTISDRVGHIKRLPSIRTSRTTARHVMTIIHDVSLSRGKARLIVGTLGCRWFWALRLTLHHKMTPNRRKVRISMVLVYRMPRQFLNSYYLLLWTWYDGPRVRYIIACFDGLD